MVALNGTPVRHRRFTVPHPGEAPGHLSFEVLARKRENPDEVVALTFRCYADPPVGAVTDMIVASHHDLGVQIERAAELIRLAIVAEDEARWDELIHSKELLIDAETVGAVTEWMVEEYVLSPFRPPSDSAPGP